MRPSPETPTLAEASRDWAKIGFLSFGGPAAQIALMHRIIVDERRWLTERQFLDGLSFCMLLPGPEAMQLATYAGWRLHGLWGGLVAGLLFVLPGAVVILALAALYAVYGDVPLAQALFLGIKAAVLIIVVEALLKVARRALNGPEHWIIAGLAFLALFVFNLPFPIVVAAAGLWGLLNVNSPADDAAPAHVAAGASLGATLRTALIWLVIWLAPIFAIDQLASGAIFGDPILGEVGRFFSVLATVTFGGAYAVLSYMAQEVVQIRGWLSPAEMVDALGLAETTPGPLILVTEFVGFLAAARANGELSLLMGGAGAAVTLWATFAPCFLWVMTGAPWIEAIASRPRLRSGLTAITAAVVGVILNLALWFGLNVAFADVQVLEIDPATILYPELASANWRVLAITALAAFLLLSLKHSVALTLGICAAAGVALSAI